MAQYLALIVLSIAIVAFVSIKRRQESPQDQQQHSTSHKLQSNTTPASPQQIPLSVNYHFLRTCNYACKFCFHTQLNSFVLPLEKAKEGLAALKAAGMKKINFSGGEPFLQEKGRMVGEMVRYCKETLQLESVTIVSNGSLIKEEWFQTYGDFLDILAISCDSFDEPTNVKIGRTSKAARANALSHIEKMEQISEWCKRYNVVFKINSVINTHNVNENMIEPILRLKPKRWKVFQCLLIEGENVGPEAKRNAEDLVITTEQYQQFIARHACVREHGVDLREEPNEIMRNSYLILDEQMRFLDCSQGKKTPSPSILDVGVAAAMDWAHFDENSFLQRGGVFEWSKPNTANACAPRPDLEW